MHNTRMKFFLLLPWIHDPGTVPTRLVQVDRCYSKLILFLPGLPSMI